LVEKVCYSDLKQILFDFLLKVIPNFQNISAVSKEKLVNSFVPITFLPGQILFEEGAKPTRIYLIQEGDVMLTSDLSPIATEVRAGRLQEKEASS